VVFAAGRNHLRGTAAQAGADRSKHALLAFEYNLLSYVVSQGLSL